MASTPHDSSLAEPRPAWRNWAEVLRTQNLSAGHEMDGVSRWLLITRASVFPMTITSGALGGLLAVAGPAPAAANWLFFALAMLGLVLAHEAVVLAGRTGDGSCPTRARCRRAAWSSGGRLARGDLRDRGCTPRP